MIEKTVFSDDEIVAQVKSNYNIITKDDNKITIAYSGEKIRH